MGTAAKKFQQNPGNNAICYYRYSSAAQRDVSIDEQRRAAHEYAEKHGLHIIKEYIDRAISGTRNDRPQFQLMLSEIEDLKPARLILWKTDRLSRDKYDAVIAKKRLRDCGVEINYVAESIPDDDEATRVIMESLYEAMAASFIESHRKNVVRGMTYNAENAIYNGVTITGYCGQVNQKYEIDKNKAPIIVKIFNEYAAGKPMKQICRNLNSAGLTTINGREFTINSLRSILTNRAYIGEYHFGDIVIPGGMPRIIEDAIFEEVQRRLEENKRGGKGALRKLDKTAPIADYWLSNVLYCGICGDPMQGMSGTSKDGTTYRYYSCNNHRKHKCSMKNQRKDFLEKIVAYVLNEIMDEPAYRVYLAYIISVYHDFEKGNNQAYAETLKAKLKEVENKLANIMKAIEAGIFNDTTAERMKELEAEKSELDDAIIAEENRNNSRLTMHRIRRYLDSCIGNAAGDEHIRETLIKTFIHKIYVYPDKLAIVCFYSEDSRELKFEDMEKLFERKRQEEERLKKQMANTRELKPEVRKVYQKMLESFIMDDDEDTDNGDENTDKSELSDIKKNHADECSHSSGLVDHLGLEPRAVRL